jgi:hypothetical protein
MTTGGTTGVAGSYAWTTQVTWGSTTYTDVGSMVIVGDPNADVAVTVDGKPGTIEHITYYNLQDPKTFISTGVLSLDVPNGVHPHYYGVTDSIDPSGFYQWSLNGQLLDGVPDVHLSGLTPPGVGGGGFATMLIGPNLVPEPSSALLLVLGLAGVGWGARSASKSGSDRR